MNLDLSVIIPLYNEERTAGSVIQIVKSWGKANEIIVVDDGSTDTTIKAISRIDGIKIISYSKNRGKGYALWKGISQSNCEYLLFLDGDVLGLTYMDLDSIVNPVIKNKATMVLGLARFWSMGSFDPFKYLTGLRLVKKSNITKILETLKTVGYGVELLLNDLHKNQKVVTVKLHYVYVLGKLEKMSISKAAKSYLKEARELMGEIIRQQRQSANPQLKQVTDSISSYIKQAIELLQQPL